MSESLLSTKSASSSPARSLKRLPSTIGKKIKRQIRRISSSGRHVADKPKNSAIGALITSVNHSIPPAPSDSSSSYSISPPPSPKTSSSARTIYTSHSFAKSQESLLLSTHSSHSSHSSKSSLYMTSEDDSLSKDAVPITVIPDEQDQPLEVEQPPPTEEPMFSSPPAIYIEPEVPEPEVPDPFLIDSDASSEEDTPAVSQSQSQATLTPQEIPLSLPAESTPSHSIGLPSPDLNKAVPPPPPSDSESDDDEAPEVYLPGLVIPTMFLPIPNTDPLSTLLTKYIYPPENRPTRDVTGEWQRSDFHTLVMTNSWRALAKMARDRLVTTDPEDLTLVLSLWYLRLACLARLRLFNQTSAECTNLFVVLNGIEPPEARAWVFDRVLPFELEVIHARLKYWAGDHMGYLDALNGLLRKCRTKARQEKGNPTAVSMWKERGARVCLIIASQLLEMKDFRAATKLLEPLCEQGDVSTADLRSAIGRIYLQSGDVQTAERHFEIVAADPAANEDLKDMNAGLLASAEGEWVRASELLAGLIARDANNFAAVNNLSVALLSQGKLKEGIDVLESALKASPSSVVVAEPFLFNLSTLYELRSATAADNKRNLLLEVAKWSGDGLRTACLKMPTT